MTYSKTDLVAANRYLLSECQKLAQQLALAYGTLEEIQNDTYCAGADCFYCDFDEPHPLTSAAVEARDTIQRIRAEGTNFIKWLKGNSNDQ